jgi:hypothetical protein
LLPSQSSSCRIALRSIDLVTTFAPHRISVPTIRSAVTPRRNLERISLEWNRLL